MDKYQNKYRIASARAQWWDYGWNAAYFITICTHNRQHFFGKIKNGNMFLSNTGVIANVLWHEIPNHSHFVDLGDFVVMPNHVHGILILDKPDGGGDPGSGSDSDSVETRHALSLPPPPPPPQQQQTSQQYPDIQPPQPGKSRFQNQGKNTVSSIIGSYKSAVTKHANRLGFENGWQPLFNDHIIRDYAEYQRISDYIIANPSNWKDDKFYSQ